MVLPHHMSCLLTYCLSDYLAMNKLPFFLIVHFDSLYRLYDFCFPHNILFFYTLISLF